MLTRSKTINCGRELRLGVSFMVLVCGVYVVFPGSPAFGAGEQFFSNHPAPKSVNEISQPWEADVQEIERIKSRKKADSVYKIWEQEGMVGRFPDWLAHQHLDFKARTYYFWQDNRDDTKSEAWTLGNWLDYDTGWLFDRVALGVSLYTSKKLVGPENRDGTELLLPGQKSFAVLGEAYGRLLLAPGHDISLFRQIYELPYLNRNDSRMAPFTFEGYSLQGYWETLPAFPGGKYRVGYVPQIKVRESNRFVNMAKAAGVEGPNRGLWMGGGQLRPTKDLNIGALNYYVPDTLNILYGEGNANFRPTREVEVSAHLQFTHQSSVGDDLLTGSDFDTLQVAGELAGSYDNVILRVALSTTSRDEEIRSPYGAAPTPLNIMIKDFGRAGEDAWLVGLSYNFEYFGLEGLSGFVNYGQGYGARGLPNEEEFDITLDYQFKSGALHHWWLRVRNGFVNEMNGGNSINNFRIILNYDLPII